MRARTSFSHGLGTARLRVLASTAAVLAMLIVNGTACGGGGAGGGDAGPVTGCPPRAAPDSVPGPTADTVKAGQKYSATLRFPSYPCVRSEFTNCHWVFYLPWPVPSWECDEVPAQGYCAPGISLVRAPPSATAVGQTIEWQSSRADEGLTAEFEVETQYPATCAQQRHAWTLTVLPAPPPPALHGISLDREVIRAGETVTVVAEFENGDGSWDFGPLSSGVPATSTPLTASRTIRVQVVNEIQEIAEEVRSVAVYGPPTIAYFAAAPLRFAGAADVTLQWDASNASAVDLTPPPDTRSAQTATTHVTETTTFRLTAQNPFGEVAAAEVTVTRVPPPIIRSFEASPAEVGVGASPSLLATFSGDRAELYVLRGAPGASSPPELLGPISSGVAMTVPPQRGIDVYRLVVWSDPNSPATADIAVPVTGPGSFAPLPRGDGIEWRTAGPALAALRDDRVFVLAGAANPSWTETAEYVDVDTLTVSPAGVFPGDARHAAVLDDGRVVVSGWGVPFVRQQIDTDPFWVFDPTGVTPMKSFPVPPSPQPRSAFEFALFGASLQALDGPRVLAYGSATALLDVTAATYAPSSYVDGLSQANESACRLADGRVLVSDGLAVLDPTANTVSRNAAPAIRRIQPFLLCLADGTALAVGGSGWSGGGFVPDVERFDPAAGTWSTIATVPAQVGAGTELADGRVFLLGVSDGYVLDPSSGAVDRVGRLAMLRDPARWRDGLRAVRLSDGRVVVHGTGAPIPELFTP